MFKGSQISAGVRKPLKETCFKARARAASDPRMARQSVEAIVIQSSSLRKCSSQ